MDFILGTLGFIQMTCLPGLILYRFFRIQANFFEKLLMVFGLSLISNYIIVFLLTLLGIYTRIVLSVIVLAEIIAIFWLFRNELNTSVEQWLVSVRDGIGQIIGFFFSARDKDDIPVWRYFLGILLLVLSARSIFWAFNMFTQNLGTVFSAWDAVVSWNKWATVWASNAIPVDSHFYPHLVPINWSITYVLMGSTTIQFFAKGLMPLFALIALVGFFNLCLQTKQYYFLFSLVIFHSLLIRFIDSGIQNGYVDIAVVFFTFATLYILIKGRATSDVEQRNRLYILGALFSAGVAVTKQAGVYIALCYPVLVMVSIFLSKIPLDVKQRRRLLLSFASISLIWISWYVIKEIQILRGADRASLDVLISLSATTYEGTSLVQQIMAAIGQYREFVILFILIAVAFPWMDRFYKVLTLLFAPYPFLWAWMASYDTRNLAIFLPVLALLAGYSVQILLDGLVKLGEKINLFRTRVYVPLALAILLLLPFNFIISPQRLHQRQVDLQKQIFSPVKNQLLYDLVEQNGPQTRILTNYPMNYLPGLEANQVSFDFDDYAVFLSHVQNPEIEYMLVPNGTADQVRDYIDQRVDSGAYEVITRNQQWKTFTLIRIIDRD